MEVNKEITALLHLIDDPDEEVFSTVSERIINIGKSIIPNLEHLWETSPEERVQERIENLIHKLHFQELEEDMLEWKNSDIRSLIDGALLVSRFEYPDLNTHSVLQEIERYRRSIWLELNSYLTSLEQVNVINKIIYSHHKIKGVEISNQQKDDFLVHKLLETKKGNSVSVGILYQYLSQLLDIPVKAVNIPKQFILGYFDNTHEYFNLEVSKPKIYFYIDPMSGQIYTQKDVDNYLNKLSIDTSEFEIEQLPNEKIIQFLLQEYSKCFDKNADQMKRSELIHLAEMLNRSI